MRLTPSSAALAEKCLFPFRPDVPEPERESTAANELGNAAHAVMAGADVEAAAAAHGVDADKVRDLTEPAQALAAEPGWEREVAIAYDPETGKARLLGRVEGRNYPINPGEIAGAIDALKVEPGRVRVRDYKSGRQAKTKPAASNPQLAIYALFAARLYGKDEAEVAIVPLAGEEPEIDAAPLDAMDLDAVEEMVREWARAIPTATPSPGAHCKDCKLVKACPSAWGALATLATAPVQITINDDTAWTLLTFVRQAVKLAGSLEAELIKFAREQGGIRRPDGTREVRRATERTFPIVRPNSEAEAALHAAGLGGAVEYAVSVPPEKAQEAARILRAAGVPATLEASASWTSIGEEAQRVGKKKQPTIRAIKTRFADLNAIAKQKGEEWDSERAA